MKNHSCFQPIIVLVLALLSFACTSSQHRAVLDSADSLMNARPDSALTLLNALLPDTNQMRKGDLMRFHLLRTNAENKCDTVLTARHAALMRRVCDYYDHKASPPWGDERGASRMLAHYLLGRCYSDMGEAPAALQEFHNAADAADTTDARVDYQLLGRIHGQAGSLFLEEEDYDDAILENLEVRRCASIVSDTVMYISAFEVLASIYETMGMVDSALCIRDKAAEMYREAGLRKKAARCIGSSIDNLVERGEIKKAKQYIDLFESESGLFDDDNNIMTGYEVYYYSKGLYLLKLGYNAEAEKQFRKLLFHSRGFNQWQAGYKGLRMFFQASGNKDSITKYSLLELQMSDSAYAHYSTESFQRIQSLYRYNRLERKAEASELKERKAENRLLVYLSVSLFLLFSLVTALSIIYHQRRKFKSRQDSLMEKQRLLQQAKDELEDLLMLKDFHMNDIAERMKIEKSAAELNLSKMAEEKIKQIENLKEQVGQLKKEVNRYRRNKRNIDLQQADIVKTFKEHVKQGSRPDYDEWRLLKSFFMDNMPDFFSQLQIHCENIKSNELELCMLVRLGFEVYEISILTNMPSTHISVMRRRLLKKIFNVENGGTKDFDRLINEIT